MLVEVPIIANRVRLNIKTSIYMLSPSLNLIQHLEDKQTVMLEQSTYIPGAADSHSGIPLISREAIKVPNGQCPLKPPSHLSSETKWFAVIVVSI